MVYLFFFSRGILNYECLGTIEAGELLTERDFGLERMYRPGLIMFNINILVIFYVFYDQLLPMRCLWTMDRSRRSSEVCVLSDLTKFNLDLGYFPMVRNSLFMIICSIAYYRLKDVLAVKFYSIFSSFSICLDGEPTVENELLFDFLTSLGELSCDSNYGGLDIVCFSFGYSYFFLNLWTSL